MQEQQQQQIPSHATAVASYGTTTPVHLPAQMPGGQAAPPASSIRLDSGSNQQKRAASVPVTPPPPAHSLHAAHHHPFGPGPHTHATDRPASDSDALKDAQRLFQANKVRKAAS
jgi:hypothetical protein